MVLVFCHDAGFTLGVWCNLEMMIMKRVHTALVAAAVAAAGATGAAAAVTGYADAAAFSAATSSLATENFNDSSKFAYTGSVPITYPGFSITRSNPTSNVADNRVDRGSRDLNFNSTGQVYAITDKSTVLTLHFNMPITAFGATFAGFNNFDQSRIVVGRDLVNPGPSTFLGQRFFGLVSDTPFDSLNFSSFNTETAVSDIFSFDDALFGNAIAPGVPEPASWAMLITGFGVIGTVMRRRRALVA